MSAASMTVAYSNNLSVHPKEVTDETPLRVFPELCNWPTSAGDVSSQQWFISCAHLIFY
jgi:hypothetical protein